MVTPAPHPILVGVPSGFAERSLAVGHADAPSWSSRDLGGGKRGFPDWCHPTPGGSQRTTLSALSPSAPAFPLLPPPVVTWLFGLQYWHGQCVCGRGSRAQAPRWGLRAVGWRSMTLRRTSELRMYGWAGKVEGHYRKGCPRAGERARSKDPRWMCPCPGPPSSATRELPQEE